MKQIIASLFLLLPISSASAQITIGDQRLTCSRSHIPQAQKWISIQSNRNDKFKHCAVSCYLRLRCSSQEVLLVGALKELYDAMGYGTPEFADFLADSRGVRLAQDGRARKDNDCVRLCSQNYPQEPRLLLCWFGLQTLNCDRPINNGLSLTRIELQRLLKRS